MLLEPIMKLEISTPDSYVGDIVSNLQQLRGLATNTEVRGHLTVIEAEAPLSSLFGYTSALRGLSQGRAANSMEPLTYRLRRRKSLKTLCWNKTQSKDYNSDEGYCNRQSISENCAKYIHIFNSNFKQYDDDNIPNFLCLF